MILPDSPETIELEIICGVCNEMNFVTVPKAGYSDWLKKRGLIQECLPQLNAAERELILSKTCNSCFDKMWSEDDDSDKEDPWSPSRFATDDEEESEDFINKMFREEE